MRCSLERALPLALVLSACGGGLGGELTTGSVPPDETVATISEGENVDLKGHLSPGKWTLFEFTADF